MDKKEKSFISAVIYLRNEEKRVEPFFSSLYAFMDRHFESFELVAVDDACTDRTVSILKQWAENMDQPLTIIHLSLYHGRENAMNAGLDIAIGDYIYEFDSLETPYDMEIAYSAFQKTQEGNDIVSVCPSETRRSSSLFYQVFNKSSHNPYQIQTDAFRIVTRRAINRVHSSSRFMPYRKAEYAASGLKMAVVEFEGSLTSRQKDRLALAIDSLALYTDAGETISMGIVAFMAAVAFLELIYTVVIFLIGKPIEGWTTMMLVLTFGLLGLFIVLSIIIRYLSLLLDMTFRKQKYLVEGIEKIQK